MTADQPVRVTLSGVRSTTHLVHAASYLRHLLGRTSGAVTVDYLGSGLFLGRDNVAADDVDRLLPQDNRLRVARPQGAARWAAGAGERRVYLSVGVPGIKPYLRLVRSAPTRPPHVVVIDEGIGSYGDWRTRRDAWRRQGGREPWPTVRSWAVTGADRLVTNERWALYEETAPGVWRVAEPVAEEFRRQVAGDPGSPGRAVFLTQPWPELGLVPRDRYTEHLQDVARACAAAGLGLWLRPHPAEDREAYSGFDVLAGRGPAELDAAVTSAEVVLGADSTALLNVAAIHGRPAYRVSMPELDRLEANLGQRQRRLLDAFLPPPSRAGQLVPALALHAGPPAGGAG